MSVIRKLSKALGSGESKERSQSPDGRNHISHSPAPLGHRALASVFGREKDYISSSDMDSDSDFDDMDGLSKNAQKREAHKAQKRQERKSRLSLENRDESDEETVKKRLEEASQEETEEMKARYGYLPIMQSTVRTGISRMNIGDLTEDMAEQDVIFRARLHHVRKLSSKLVFLIFRQQLNTIQGVLAEEKGAISLVMMHWTEHLHTGSIVLVRGKLNRPKIPVKSTTIHSVEVHITDLKVITKRADPVPFSVQEADLIIRDDAQKLEGRQSQISDRVRLGNRIMDLRTGASQSIFRIQSGVGNLWRAALDDRGFTEIHSPKLQGAATESGASVFKVNYFGRPSFLAQSPQLAKQMAIASDFERVYEIGAVFRAENSNTHRHLTEYTGLDLEMAIEEHYHEMMEVVDATLKTIFQGIYNRYRKEVDVIKQQFPHEDLVWLDKTPVILFKDAIQMLTDSGWRDEGGEELSPLEDFGTRDEIRFGELVKERYGTDYYIVDKFPRSVRPFYTMPDPEDDRYSNSFDVFVRGQEIISGGQRIHESKLLEENMRKVGIEPDDMADYMEGFRWAAPPHAGAGVGLERIVMLLLKLGNIRLASMFHRDPRSFPAKAVELKLRHPDADTLHPAWKRDGKGPLLPLQKTLPSLEDLIANYGDSTHTSWGDQRFKIWQHQDTGAMVAYVVEGHHAILPGDPLCDQKQYYRIIVAFLHWLKKETHLKPIWILASREVGDVLGERLGWKTLSPVVEERVDVTKKIAEQDTEVSRKIRKAQSDGVKIQEFDKNKPTPQELKDKVTVKTKDWLQHRKGTQIHLSTIDPFRDEQHRRYFIAEDRNGDICGIAVLAEIAPRHGMQAKYTVDFPGAPSGTVEYLTVHALNSAATSGVTSVTFGGGAASHITAGHHIGASKMKLLSSTYDTLVKQFNLARKSEFRSKMGADPDPLYICYPKKGLSIRAIMRFFQDE